MKCLQLPKGEITSDDMCSLPAERSVPFTKRGDCFLFWWQVHRRVPFALGKCIRGEVNTHEYRRGPWSDFRLFNYLLLENRDVNADFHNMTELTDPGVHHTSQIFLPKYLKEKGR